MFGNSVSGRNFSFLDGVAGGFHEISHHANNPKKLKMYTKINRFHIELYAEMLQKMKAVKEGDETLLDNSLVLFGSGLRNGNAHSPVNLPILLGGKGGRKLPTGMHRLQSKAKPLCNLLLGMMQCAGVDVKNFGNSTQSLI